MPNPAITAVPALLIVLCTGCTDSRIATVRAFRAARDRGDLDTARSYLAPDARIWFEQRTGPGEPWTLGGGTWAAWDGHFRSQSTHTRWQANGDAVTALATEINDYYRLTERGPQTHRETWFLDGHNHITGFLVQSLPGSTRGRMDEFLAWARRESPDELNYLMPGGRLDPAGDRASRFRVLLNRWRVTVGLPEID